MSPIFPGAAAAQGNGVSAKLEALTPHAAAQDPVLIRYTVSNNGREAIRVLKLGTPLEGEFNSRLFHVESDGKEVPYIGRLVKRGPPTPADFQTIAPGETVKVDLDLAKGYALYQRGRYSVRARSQTLKMPKSPGSPVEMKALMLREAPSNAVEFELVDARPEPPTHAVAPLKLLTVEEMKQPIKAKEAAFQGCSATQQNDLNDALSHASTLGAGADLALEVTPVAKRSSAPRYATWFGAYTAARYDTAITHFQKIQSALANETVTFHCDCNDAGVYAYVYPNQPYHIHLCGAFWAASLDGTDSRAGTLIHETSHFNVTAGTDDHVYGQSACKALALSNPDDALDNADSHEYYAENNPAQAMGSDAIAVLLLLVLAAIVAERLLRRRWRPM